MHSMEEKKDAFERLLIIMDELREQCPWDRKQTFQSLRKLTIEETYELADAILDEDLEEIKKEVGDIMLHLVFYAKLGDEKKAFDIADVIHATCDKLVHRHPHIYGDVEVADEEEVKKNWEQLKLKEGKESVLEGVPKSLPAVVKASRIQEKARGVGFDWEHGDQVWEKVQEEMQEFKEAKTSAEREQEFGDLMFSLINYARFVDIDPEAALERTNKKFIRRFQHLESAVKKSGKSWNDLSLSDMDVYWDEAKKMED